MKVTGMLKLRKMSKASRAERLSAIIRRYADGRFNDSELEGELKALYNRQGESRSTLAEGDSLDAVTGLDPVYQQVLALVKASYPQRGELREDQLDSYVNTVSARANTAERLSEYAARGTELVKVVAYIDPNTTEICRMMHGRVFELGGAVQRENEQSNLVHPASFWQGNDNFSQASSPDMEPWLPPYHYNCRTRVVPYSEPSDPYDAALDRANNLIKMQKQHISALVSKALNFEFDSREQLFDHYAKHQDDLGVSTQKQYQNLVSDLLKNPLKQMGLARSARDGSLNLYVWDPKLRDLDGVMKHDFAVFNLDKNTLKTFYPKNIDFIMNNLDATQHGKVMLLTPQIIKKGDKMAVGEHCVKCYEYILDYFEKDDSTDEQEMFSRLGMEKDWDSIPLPLKQRILAVDRIVLEKYADYFDYNVFNAYIKTIKARVAIEDGS